MDKQIVIVGGGVIGLTAALALAKHDFDILVIDAKTLCFINHEKHDLRVFAINHASKALFSYCDVWGAIKKERHCAYQKMSVWDEASCGDIHFDCLTQAKDELGYIIEETIIKNALLNKISNVDNITLIDNSPLKNINRNESTIDVTLKNDKRITTKLLLGCDGANSWVRKKMAIATKQYDYGHHALVCTVQTEKPHNKTARQVFTRDGPLAFLPLDDPHLCSIVWSTTPEKIKILLAQNDNSFNTALSKAFLHKMGKCKVLSKRLSFPLHMRHVKHYCLAHLALLGDAAHTIHPLAGQGINLGLLDVATFTQCLMDNKEHFYKMPVLRRYERWRVGHAWAMIAAMEGLKKIFSPSPLLPNQLKALGMQLTNHCIPVKSALIERAMGFKGDFPKLINDNLRC